MATGLVYKLLFKGFNLIFPHLFLYQFHSHTCFHLSIKMLFHQGNQSISKPDVPQQPLCCLLQYLHYYTRQDKESWETSETQKFFKMTNWWIYYGQIGISRKTGIRLPSITVSTYPSPSICLMLFRKDFLRCLGFSQTTKKRMKQVLNIWR